MPKLGQLFRTLKYLKAGQLYYQLHYRVCRYAYWQKPKCSAELVRLSSAWPKEFQAFEPSGSDACFDLKTGQFRFIGLVHRFGDCIDWSGSPHGKLWNYNLHYFEWLWGLDIEDAKAVTLDWIQRCPYSKSAEGWEPYPLSLRITNWIAFWGGRPNVLEGDPTFANALCRSLTLQCDWLTQRLEKHILGNHYLENAVALWMAGTFIEGGSAAKFLKLGGSILDEQFAEQILQDGMHFERSPMYHNRVLWLLSLLKQLDGNRFGALFDNVKTAALRLQHPDGRVALFNDSAFGIYPEVKGVAPVGCYALEASGYYGMRNASGDYLICDAGRIGPDYLPGHAHCDVGSFELSVAGQRLITDTGVYHYIHSPRRHRSRTTVAHNVFAPEGVEQAEIWSAFRVGNRPSVTVQEWENRGEAFRLKLSHNGFEDEGVSVMRSFDYDGAQKLTVTDVFEAAGATKMLGHLHLAPGVTVVDCQDGEVRLNHGGREVSVRIENGGDVSVQESEYYPEFNVCLSRPCIVYCIAGTSGEVRIHIEWSI